MNGKLSPDILQGLTQEVFAVAHRAGECVLEIYRGDYDIEEKADNTPLTTADLKASELIERELTALDPRFPVLSEESRAQAFEARRDWRTYWLVDPLDGTREFIKGSGEFAVNIALVHEGRPVIGVIHAPAIGDSYYACAGSGASKLNGTDGAVSIKVRPVPEQGPVVARSRSRNPSDSLLHYLAQLGEHEEIAMGSSLKSCLVAEGRADVYAGFGPTSEWDTAAAQCIVEEAGGQITDTAMRPLRYNTRSSLLNPHFLVFGDACRDWSVYLQ